MKSVDINQRIPLDSFDSILTAFILETYSDEYALEQLRLEFKGENRLIKSLRIVKKLTKRNPLANLVMEHKQMMVSAMKKKNDRNIILIAHLNSAFSFSFDLLSIFGKYFNVQDQISRSAINKSISAIYGGNRTTANAIDSVVPMFIEAGFMERPKSGLYQKTAPIAMNFQITKKLFLESFKVNKPVGSTDEFIYGDPYFNFIDIS